MKFFLLILLVPFLMGAGCTKNSPTGSPEETQAAIEVVEDLLEEVDDTYKVRGSCDTIASASHCLDYIGSMWTEEQMTLNCQGVGIFKKTTCPYSTNGGCRAGAGTITETVLWSYDQGANPIGGENLQYEIKACDLNPIGTWVTADQLFLKE